MLNKAYYVGVDIGGTNLKIGLVNKTGQLEKKIYTDKYLKDNSITRYVIKNIIKLMENGSSNIISVGIGIPGEIDKKKGIAKQAANASWGNLNITKEIEQTFGIPVFLENDANVAVLAEKYLGKFSNCKNIAYIGLGTGIGSGFIINDWLVPSSELGHIIANPKNGDRCNCGTIGCLEATFSGNAISRKAQKVLDNNNDITAKDVIYKAINREKWALKIIKESCYYLVLAIYNIYRLLEPEVFILGGGLMENDSGQFITKMIKYNLRNINKKYLDKININHASFGQDNGIIGAAIMCKNELFN